MLQWNLFSKIYKISFYNYLIAFCDYTFTSNKQNILGRIKYMLLKSDRGDKFGS